MWWNFLAPKDTVPIAALFGMENIMEAHPKLLHSVW